MASSRPRLVIITASMLVLSASLLWLLASFGNSSPLSHVHSNSSSSSSLANFALQKVLSDASPIFGDYVDARSKQSLWMSKYPDNTPLAHMNIPGTHDAATWNYSLATQQSLDHVTAILNLTEFNPAAYRCQDKSIIYMLDAGIRVFDLRYAYDVTNTTLVFWHGPGLQSETATVDDVMYGFYNWLDDHPSEAIFLSFQYEGSTTPMSSDSAGVQLQLFDTLTSPAAKQYIRQDHTLGTLGSARGKITLLRRFDLDQLPASYGATIPGLHFSPTNWTDNSPNITLVYSDQPGATAYIEDYYQPLTPQGSSAEENIQWKLNATIDHLRYAASGAHSDSLFWSFASSTNVGNVPADTPEIQALGNGTLTPDGGVNQRLVPFLREMEGKRLGVVMFDFFEQPSELLPLFLSLLPPSKISS